MSTIRTSGVLTLLLAGCALPACATTDAHPRLLFDAAGLAELRALAQQTEPSVYGFSPAEGWEKVLAKATSLAAAPTYSYSVTIPAANSEHEGWKWTYTLSADPPPRHDESPHYPPWTAMFQERGDSITTRLKHFSLAYAVTGDEAFYQKAHDIVFKLIQWPYWTDPSYSNGNLSACLDTGHCTQNVALFYDWCYDAMTADERAAVREALVRLGIEPIRAQLAKLDPYHNFWAVVNTGYGTAALALAGEDERADEWIAEAIVNTRRQFDSQGEDGGSYEGPMYGTYAADMLAQLIVALDTSQTPHELRDHPFLATLPRFAVNGLSPHVKGLPTFGDGGFGAGYPLTMAMLAAAGDDAARFYLTASNHLAALDDIDEFLFFGPLLGADTLPEPPAWRSDDAFVDIGYAFLRGADDQPYLAFKAGPPSKWIGHNHFDQNSFQITAFTDVVAADPGYRSYFNPPARRYTVGSVGHNTIVLDLDDEYLASEAVSTKGHDQVQLIGGRITELFPSPGISLVAGEAAAAYNPEDLPVLNRFLRRIVFLPPNAYVVRDELIAPQPRRFSWLLHGTPAARVEVGEAGVTLVQPGSLLDAVVLAPGGVAWRAGRYDGAEQYGPYAAATTPEPAQAATFTAALVPRPNDELLFNPGFEEGLQGWTIRNADNQGPNHSATKEQIHSGEQAGRIDGAGYLYSNRFRLAPGTPFTARVWYRTDGATKGATFTAYFWAGGRAFANKTVTDLISEGEWTQAEIAGVVPEGTEEINLALNYFDTGVGYWDDVTLEADRPERALAAPPTITPLDGEDGLRIEAGGWRHEVRFADGATRALSYDPRGELVRALLSGGTELAADGRTLLRTSQPATVSAERIDGQWRAEVRTDLTPGAEAVDPAAVGLQLGE